MRKIRNSNTVYHQMDNSRYHWTIAAFQFNNENIIKAIDWPSYSSDLNPIKFFGSKN